MIADDLLVLNTIPFGIGKQFRTMTCVNFIDQLHRCCCVYSCRKLDRIAQCACCEACQPYSRFFERCCRHSGPAKPLGDKRRDTHPPYMLNYFLTYPFQQSFGYLFTDDVDVVRLVSKVMPLVASFQVGRVNADDLVQYSASFSDCRWLGRVLWWSFAWPGYVGYLNVIFALSPTYYVKVGSTSVPCLIL